MSTDSSSTGSTSASSADELWALLERLTHVARLATMGEMAAGVAHELNQPLTAIASYAQACDYLLSQERFDIAEIRNALRQITAQSLRAGEIIRRLRSLVRTPDGERTLTNINDVISELKAIAQTDARVHSVRLSLELASDLPPVMVHRLEIQQVMLTLLRNAVEALEGLPPERREVVLRTARTDDGHVEIRVIDRGPGVDARIADRLFSPFVSTKPGGAGLGLAIGRSIVEAHKGTLRYVPPGAEGACFVLQLPHAQGGA